MVLEPREIHRGVELEEIREGGEAGARVEVVGTQLELVDQHREERGGQVGVVLQPDRIPHAALPHARLHARQEVGRGLARQRDLGVAGDPDGVAGDDLVAGVERGQLEPDHVLEQHERVLAGRPGQRHEAGHDLARDAHHGQGGVRQDTRRHRLDRDDQAERAVGEVRERMPGVDRQRGEDRHERPPEIVLQEPLLLGGDLLGTDEPDAFRREDGPQLLQEAAVLGVDQPVDLVGDRGEGLGRGHLVRPHGGVARADPALQLRDPDHEELVEVRAEDGQELDPLEQRDGRVLGLLEHTAVELEPGQLAIDERVGGNRAHDDLAGASRTRKTTRAGRAWAAVSSARPGASNYGIVTFETTSILSHR